MRIPAGAIVLLFTVSFMMLAFQYDCMNPVRRVVNLDCALMVDAIVLMFAVNFSHLPLWLGFFVLALVWSGLSLYLFRFLAPSKY